MCATHFTCYFLSALACCDMLVITMTTLMTYIMLSVVGLLESIRVLCLAPQSKPLHHMILLKRTFRCLMAVKGDMRLNQREKGLCPPLLLLMSTNTTASAAYSWLQTWTANKNCCCDCMACFALVSKIAVDYFLPFQVLYLPTYVVMLAENAEELDLGFTPCNCA